MRRVRNTFGLRIGSVMLKRASPKALEGIFVSENARPLWALNPHFCDQFEDYFTGNMVFFPHFRPVVPVIEKLEKVEMARVRERKRDG